MPIYEYRCKECHQVFEEWSKHFEDESITHSCPVCRGVSTRLMSNTSFSLKGSGWYATEYGSHKQDANAAKPAAPESTESKPVAESSAPAAAVPCTSNCTA